MCWVRWRPQERVRWRGGARQEAALLQEAQNVAGRQGLVCGGGALVWILGGVLLLFGPAVLEPHLDLRQHNQEERFIRSDCVPKHLRRWWRERKDPETCRDKKSPFGALYVRKTRSFWCLNSLRLILKWSYILVAQPKVERVCGWLLCDLSLLPIYALACSACSESTQHLCGEAIIHA